MAALITIAWLNRNMLKHEYNVVVMYSHDKGQFSYTEMCNTFKEEFDRLGDNVNLRYCYLGCERWGHDHEIIESKRLLEEALHDGKIDLLITVGDQASYSAMQTGIDLVKKVPVVFGGVLYPNPKLLKKFPNYTGFRDSIDIVKNIYVTADLSPSRATYTMLDATYLDRCTRRNITEQIAEHDDIVSNLDWKYSLYAIKNLPADKFSITPFSMRDLASNTSQEDGRDTLGANNLMFVMRNYSKMTYIQMKYDSEAIAMIRMNGHKAMITAIGMDFGRPGSNFIGGYFASSSDIARDIAGRASKILRGAKPESFSIVSSAKRHYIDWNVAKANGFNLNELPQGYNVVNLSWKEEHKLLFYISIGAAIIVLFALFFYLLYAVFKERRLRTEAQRHLERENIKFNMAVQNSLTFAWERVGTTIYLNDSFWEHYGKKPHTTDVSDFTMMLHPDSRETFEKGIEIVNSGELFASEVRGDFSGKGTYHWYLIRGKGIMDKNKNCLRSYGMIMKIDELKEREHELEEARRLAEEATLKESFLANMSHEIRTPLNAIVGFSDLLAMPDSDYSDEDKKMFIDTIHTNNELLLKLINDILDVSRIESGVMEFIIKPYNISEIMHKVYQTFILQIPEHLEFIYKDDTDVTVHVDEARLRQVMTNFLTNASKFTPQGSITLGWEIHNDTGMVELYVEDTGIGLADEERKMVFSRFYKKDEFKQGTGLGLSICKSIIIRLGGQIKVKSQLGKGSRFSVFLNIEEVGGVKTHHHTYTIVR